jgi:predicted protein tyrosine phosphatase
MQRLQFKKNVHAQHPLRKLDYWGTATVKLSGLICFDLPDAFATMANTLSK